jgi:hypothetical protein
MLYCTDQPQDSPPVAEQADVNPLGHTKPGESNPQPLSAALGVVSVTEPLHGGLCWNYSCSGTPSVYARDICSHKVTGDDGALLRVSGALGIFPTLQSARNVCIHHNVYLYDSSCCSMRASLINTVNSMLCIYYTMKCISNSLQSVLSSMPAAPLLL